MASIMRFYECQSASYSSITNSFTLVGVTLQRTLRNVIFQNLTDAQIDISFDGSKRNLTLPAMSGYDSDICANQIQNQTGLFLNAGTNISVRYTSGAPTTGEFVYTGYYGKGD